MALPTYKDIVDLIKKGATVEAQEQIMALREAALELQEQNIELRDRVRSLEEALRTRERLEFDGRTYWLRDGNAADGPYCQHCYDANAKLIRLQDWGDTWFCVACKFSFEKRPVNETSAV
ncbi:MAG: hypothetical protein WHX93_05330 [bacterium]